MGTAENTGDTVKHRDTSASSEVPFVLLDRRKLLSRRRHFPSWSPPDEGESFHFLNDILIQ